MKKFFDEFKKFITRGNVLDMAVGIIVGSAFTSIVTALNKSVLTPFIGALFGGKDLKGLYVPLWNAEKIIGETDAYGNQLYTSAIYYGEFIQAIIDFIMIAFVLFVIVKVFNKIRELSDKTTEALKKKEEEKTAVIEASIPKKPTVEELLTDIKDLLANNKQ